MSVILLLSSGNSRIKKVMEPLWGQRKSRGWQHKCPSCMVIFRFSED